MISLPEPFCYPGGKTGVLLIHGFTGSPNDMKPLGRFLQDKGYTVHAPVLKGHGTNYEALSKTEWSDWQESALKAYERLLATGVERVFIVGLSMGAGVGFTIAINKKVAGIISLCCPVLIKDRRFSFVNPLKRVAKYAPGIFKRIPGTSTHNLTTLTCISELRKGIRVIRKCLSHITAPTLIVQASQDEVVHHNSAVFIFKRIKSPVKSTSLYEKSNHMILSGPEREKVFDEIARFLSLHSP